MVALGLLSPSIPDSNLNVMEDQQITSATPLAAAAGTARKTCTNASKGEISRIFFENSFKNLFRTFGGNRGFTFDSPFMINLQDIIRSILFTLKISCNF
jgi:hypothetical protein